MRNSILVCAICGGENIEEKLWVNVNTKKIKQFLLCTDNSENWCNDCLAHTDFIAKKDFKKEENV